MKLKTISAIALFTALTVLTIQTAFAEVSLGSGFVCDEGTLSKNGAEKDATKIQKSLKRKKKRLRNNVNNSSGAQKKKLQRKLKRTRKTLTGIVNCSKGSLADSGRTLKQVVKDILGSYPNGTYQFGSSLNGTITAEFGLRGSMLEGTIFTDEFLQSLFGTDPLEISGDTNGASFPMVFDIPSTPVGPVTISLNSDLSLVLLADEVPGTGIGSIAWTGTFTRGAGFEGDIVLTDEDRDPLFTGSLAILK